MEILGYVLVNPDKVERAINGVVGPKGALMGGVGEKASDSAKIAEYDRLGGLITKDGKKLEIGCFYDFAKKQARKKPEVKFVFWVERKGKAKKVLVDEGEEIPVEVRAAQLLKEQEELDEE